uniref:Uncharacterized protein n=1 Tax=Pipistrellus kuhlii TaxID=59472 RepID=A0A7J8A7Q0_PIPKU|nr:hypothetical protein mPipKuh1_008904 [Pipistrellus kuhlii]
MQINPPKMAVNLHTQGGQAAPWPSSEGPGPSGMEEAGRAAPDTTHKVPVHQAGKVGWSVLDATRGGWVHLRLWRGSCSPSHAHGPENISGMGLLKPKPGLRPQIHNFIGRDLPHLHRDRGSAVAEDTGGPGQGSRGIEGLLSGEARIHSPEAGVEGWCHFRGECCFAGYWTD